ncbi:poly (ADP-ribose) glycohydrolase (macronuclear) [Tetrahymena thermophila SB210]|uniref:Poly (ADP-ribose) glycohydrolase n=1 Tax=Tetrahymena thermophila (strain SB210) TaxID=312017 RepID=I7MIM8_TETTS|nr:poly (ADP-ribose) glycohydrolase [Tetrahymena thermophila SB210]EAR93859.2 poly (ADP-ribose) glycohydrolase [Tetrahymena thermophila SB210]|eukprot:XP_001014104.2 poly (ADP-ribose) glycohydrolase [Tetrahymena thermophila SB210]
MDGWYFNSNFRGKIFVYFCNFCNEIQVLRYQNISIKIQGVKRFYSNAINQRFSIYLYFKIPKKYQLFILKCQLVKLLIQSKQINLKQMSSSYNKALGTNNNKNTKNNLKDTEQKGGIQMNVQGIPLKNQQVQTNQIPAAGKPSKKNDKNDMLNQLNKKEEKVIKSEGSQQAQSQKNTTQVKKDSQIKNQSQQQQHESKHSTDNNSKAQIPQNGSNAPNLQQIKQQNYDYEQHGQQHFDSDQGEEQKELQPNTNELSDNALKKQNLICQLGNLALQRDESKVQINKICEDNKNQSIKIRIDQDNSFEASIEDLLKQKIKDFQIESKLIIYSNYIHSLNSDDIKLAMKYIRIVDNIPLPQITNPSITYDRNNFTYKESIYMYEKPTSALERHWYVNFADQNLFDFYNTSLFAQDEIQVSEHPLLAHVLEKVQTLKSKYPQLAPKTYNGLTPTPILITNCHRLGTVDTQGAKFYGNNFQRMTKQELQKNMKVFDKNKTVSNIICMAAMGYKRGYYTQEQIKFTLETAYKSFYAARYITEQYNICHKCVINTGNWGCGAFGNNPECIALIQLIAAQLAGIEILVYHTFNKNGTYSFKDGQDYYQKYVLNMQGKNPKLDDIVNYIYNIKFKWGQSDGN